MFYLVDSKTDKRYKILRWDNIKAGDCHINFDDANESEIAVTVAEYDYPDNFGSFILEPEPDKVCWCGKISEGDGVCPGCTQNMGRGEGPWGDGV